MKFIPLLFVILVFPLILSNTTSCNEELPLNNQIIAFVKSKMKKTVGKGECWDLAAEALNLVEAKWDGEYEFGKKIDYTKDCVYPGDIVQFKDVHLKYIENGENYEELMEHHTAIIYEVKGQGDYMLAHQNTAFTGRKVGTSPLHIKDISQGTITIFRSTKE